MLATHGIPTQTQKQVEPIKIRPPGNTLMKVNRSCFSILLQQIKAHTYSGGGAYISLSAYAHIFGMEFPKNQMEGGVRAGSNYNFP